MGRAGQLLFTWPMGLAHKAVDQSPFHIGPDCKRKPRLRALLMGNVSWARPGSSFLLGPWAGPIKPLTNQRVILGRAPRKNLNI